MIPDATAMAQGSTLVDSAFTSYPILPVIFGVIIVVSLGVYVVSKLRRIVGGR